MRLDAEATGSWWVVRKKERKNEKNMIEMALAS